MENNNYKVALNDQSIAVNSCDYMVTLTSLHVSVHWKAGLSLFYSLFEISGRWKFDSPIWPWNLWL